MTSKNLFFNLMKEDFKRRLWTAALSFLVFFFTLPVASAMVTARWSESAGTDPKFYLSMVNAVKSYLGTGNGIMGTIIVFASLVLGVNSFSWLHSKQKVDFYHSIPVRREKLFLVNYLDGILIPLAAYALNLVIAIVIVMANGIPLGEIFLPAVSALGFYMLHYALLYSVTVLAMVLTGNIVVGILGTGVFHFFFPCLLFAIDGFFGKFLMTSYDGDSGLIDVLIGKCSALTMFIENYVILDSDYTTGEIALRMAAVAAVTAVITVLSLILCKKRGSEAAGKAMAFNWSKPVVRIPIVILSSMLGSMFFWSMHSSFGWAVFGVICGMALSHCIIEIIYHFDFKKLFSHRVQMAVCGAAALAVFLGFRYDLFGYDSYIPSPSSVQSMAVSFGNMQYWMDYGTAIKKEDGSYSWDYVPRSEYIFDHTEFSDAEITAARSLVARAVEQVRQQKLDGEEYVWGADERHLSFSVQYKMKSGREVYRSYSVRGDEMYQDFLLLSDSPAYRMASLQILHQSPEETDTAVVQTDDWSKDVGPEYTSRLLLAYQKDLLGITSAQMEHENPLARIQFLTPVQTEARENIRSRRTSDAYSYVVERGYYPIYPSFTETIAILNESEIQFDPALTAGEVQAISMNTYQLEKLLQEEMEDVFDDKYDLTFEVTDRAEIAEIMKNAVPESYSDMNTIRGEGKKLYFDVTAEKAAANMASSGKIVRKAYSLLLDEAPEFLIEKAKEEIRPR